MNLFNNRAINIYKKNSSFMYVIQWLQQELLVY